MDYALTELIRFYVSSQRHAEPLVLATVLRTEGSTYRKAGARVLITADGKTSGLLSGGCLEADLRARARRVHANLKPERHLFDTRKAEDPIFGLNMGCEGAIDVWLQPCPAAEPHGLIAHFKDCLDNETESSVATVVGGDAAALELGVSGHAHQASGTTAPDELRRLLASLTAQAPELRRVRFEGRDLEVFVAPVGLPPALLICGAGPDAVPLNALANSLGWRVSVYDHRPAFAARELFPQARRVLLDRPEALAERLDLGRFDAAVIMSHHLPSDIAYLQALARTPPRYLGLLGPARRRERVFVGAGVTAPQLEGKLYGPAGLDIGASTPETIALSIVAQIQAVLAGRHLAHMARATSQAGSLIE